MDTLYSTIMKASISVALGPWYLRPAASKPLEEEVRSWSLDDLDYAEGILRSQREELERKQGIVREARTYLADDA